MSEMDKLEQGLIKRGISYDRHPLWDGEQIKCDGWDAICLYGSYGYEKGLLEVMGLNVYPDPEDEEDDYDDVIGNLTAKEILNALDAR